MTERPDQGGGQPAPKGPGSGAPGGPGLRSIVPSTLWLATVVALAVLAWWDAPFQRPPLSSAVVGVVAGLPVLWRLFTGDSLWRWEEGRLRFGDKLTSFATRYRRRLAEVTAVTALLAALYHGLPAAPDEAERRFAWLCAVWIAYTMAALGADGPPLATLTTWATTLAGWLRQHPPPTATTPGPPGDAEADEGGVPVTTTPAASASEPPWWHQGRWVAVLGGLLTAGVTATTSLDTGLAAMERSSQERKEALDKDIASVLEPLQKLSIPERARRIDELVDRGRLKDPTPLYDQLRRDEEVQRAELTQALRAMVETREATESTRSAVKGFADEAGHYTAPAYAELHSGKLDAVSQSVWAVVSAFAEDTQAREQTQRAAVQPALETYNATEDRLSRAQQDLRAISRVLYPDRTEAELGAPAVELLENICQGGLHSTLAPAEACYLAGLWHRRPPGTRADSGAWFQRGCPISTLSGEAVALGGAIPGEDSLIGALSARRSMEPNGLACYWAGRSAYADDKLCAAVAYWDQACDLREQKGCNALAFIGLLRGPEEAFNGGGHGIAGQLVGKLDAACDQYDEMKACDSRAQLLHISYLDRVAQAWTDSASTQVDEDIEASCLFDAGKASYDKACDAGHATACLNRNRLTTAAALQQLALDGDLWNDDQVQPAWEDAAAGLLAPLYPEAISISDAYHGQGESSEPGDDHRPWEPYVQCNLEKPRR